MVSYPVGVSKSFGSCHCLTIQCPPLAPVYMLGSRRWCCLVEVVESLGCVVYLEAIGHWNWTLMLDSPALLPIFSLLPYILTYYRQYITSNI